MLLKLLTMMLPEQRVISVAAILISLMTLSYLQITFHIFPTQHRLLLFLHKTSSVELTSPSPVNESSCCVNDSMVSEIVSFDICFLPNHLINQSINQSLFVSGNQSP